MNSKRNDWGKVLDSFRYLHIPSFLIAFPNLHRISGVVIFISMVYHKIGTVLRCFLIVLILLYQRTGALCCQCTNIIASETGK